MSAVYPNSPLGRAMARLRDMDPRITSSAKLRVRGGSYSEDGDTIILGFDGHRIRVHISAVEVVA